MDRELLSSLIFTTKQMAFYWQKSPTAIVIVGKFWQNTDEFSCVVFFYKSNKILEGKFAAKINDKVPMVSSFIDLV